jgi:hypothetical protein
MIYYELATSESERKKEVNDDPGCLLGPRPAVKLLSSEEKSKNLSSSFFVSFISFHMLCVTRAQADSKSYFFLENTIKTLYI